MNEATIDIKGARGLLKTIERLPDSLQKSAERAVLTAGARPIRKAARTKVPVDSGLLKKSLGLNVKKLKGQTTARVGARRGFRQTVVRDGQTEVADPANYSHLVEYGTSHSPAKPFIRPAVESSQGEVLDAMAEGLSKYLDRTARRLRR